MSSLSLIVPVCLQVPAVLQELRRNLKTWQGGGLREILILCNRLTLMPREALQQILCAESPLPVRVIHDKERSVAGAWNHGIRLAVLGGADHFLITAVDVAFRTNTASVLSAFGERYPEIDLWSSTANNELENLFEESVDRCDFSCFMLRFNTIEKYGWFDREYKPAYFEDNDYVTRVVLGGGHPKQVRLARHVHTGSLTVRNDPEMAHHVNHWFGINSARFHTKWGVKTDDYKTIASVCNRTPNNSGRPLSWWQEQDRLGYEPDGGIHE